MRRLEALGVTCARRQSESDEEQCPFQSLPRMSALFRSRRLQDARRAQFGTGLLGHRPRTLQPKRRHDERDRDVGPSLMGAEDAEGGQEYRKIAKYIIAGTQPHRAHVGISRAMRPQKRKYGTVGDKRHNAD